jgi:endonuclease/exonuclease/phosphatase family metal-dependent hydrolase
VSDGAAALRVVTYNTGRNAAPYPERLGPIGRGLAALGADVICLQECLVSVDRRYDTAGELAAALGKRASVALTRRKRREVAGEPLDTWSALVVLADEAIEELGAHALPDDPDDGERRVQLVRVGGWVVANTHLTHLRDARGGALRERQWAEVIGRLDALASPALVCGDLNAGPGDAWFDALRGDARFAVPPLPYAPTHLGGLLHGVDGPATRAVDHVIGYHAGRPLRRATALAEVDPGIGVTPSDHAAVVVDL